MPRGSRHKGLCRLYQNDSDALTLRRRSPSPQSGESLRRRNRPIGPDDRRVDRECGRMSNWTWRTTLRTAHTHGLTPAAVACRGPAACRGPPKAACSPLPDPAALRRCGRTRRTSWLAARGVRHPARVAATALTVAHAQHIQLPGHDRRPGELLRRRPSHVGRRPGPGRHRLRTSHWQPAPPRAPQPPPSPRDLPVRPDQHHSGRPQPHLLPQETRPRRLSPGDCASQPRVEGHERAALDRSQSTGRDHGRP
ncbi:hypothetical protein SRB17_48810 [Streptomyces sp. RB17]|nr:hypothetical protein [Streptomyces sp. RB17]